MGVARSAQLALLTLTLSSAAGFGGLTRGATAEPEPYVEKQAPAAFTAAAERCRDRLGHTLGAEWMSCVIDELLAAQASPVEGAPTLPFAVVPHTYDPLQPDPKYRMEPGYRAADELRFLLRDFSCDSEDGGSQPIRSFDWTYQPPDPCADTFGGGAAGAGTAGGGDAGAAEAAGFVYRGGFLPAGDDLPYLHGRMTESAAAARCTADPLCAGFTYNGGDRGRAGGEEDMLFKSTADNVALSPEWHSLRKRSAPGLDCRHGFRPPPPLPVTFTVQVVREEPPVLLVDGFVSKRLCDAMINHTIPKMGRSVVSGGGFSNARRSYSVNMYPELDDPGMPVTQVARALFSFAREVGGYESLVEGPGQEPVNAVFYKDNGDQYTPHCDGECNGGRWREGKRIATGLVYCEAPEKGGATLFTKSGLKVVPARGRLLFFGYKLRDPESITGWKATMDNGHTEHSGCPLRKGRKWIATMWFREGVSAEKDWQSMRDL